MTDDDLRAVLRRAMSDPGTHTPRQALHEGWDGAPDYESVPNWQARAVPIALAAAGYSIIRADELERLRSAALPEGTETEWAVRIDSGDITAEDEATARKLLGMFRENGTPAGLCRHQVTPWTEVPDEKVPEAKPQCRRIGGCLAEIGARTGMTDTDLWRCSCGRTLADIDPDLAARPWGEDGDA